MRYFITMLFLVTSVYALTPEEIERHYDSNLLQDDEGVKDAIKIYLEFKYKIDDVHQQYIHKLVRQRWAKKLNIELDSDYAKYVDLSDGRITSDEVLISEESKSCIIKLIYFTTEEEQEAGEFMYLRCVEQFVQLSN